MIAYVDSSVLLRVALGELNRVSCWDQIDHGVTCELTRVETLRTIDRMRLRLGLTDEEVASRNVAVFSLLDHMDLVLISSTVLARASQPFPTTIGTLDAIHLSSALLWQQNENQELRFLTHDVELGRAARSVGMHVLGS